MTARRCPDSGKNMYRTLQTAENVISHLHRVANPGRRLPVRAYQCSSCQRWHLTSKGLTT